MIININDIETQWVRESVINCQTCRQTDEFGSTFICGWHENVTAAVSTLHKFMGEERDS